MDFTKFVAMLRSKSISDVTVTPHCGYRLQVRGIPKGLVKELLYNPQGLRGVIQQAPEGRFKLYYAYTEDKDLIIIVDARHVKSKLKLTVVTVFPQPSKRRTKVKEYGGEE
ncbi:hypothetical protein APY94_01915 [Thermococcus celericrescens]|uniref:DUF4258 domain-containing protein n=1 Tax=Thermococcus celericrescens TaxID=227598 RepID=A0A117ITV3_9EURY|nr:hypothetical protein APY94_01915 [Thermococcus celericrescens]